MTAYLSLRRVQEYMLSCKPDYKPHFGSFVLEAAEQEFHGVDFMIDGTDQGITFTPLNEADKLMPDQDIQLSLGIRWYLDKVKDIPESDLTASQARNIAGIVVTEMLDQGMKDEI